MIYSSPATWGKLQVMGFLKGFFEGQEADNFKLNYEGSSTEIMIISQKEVTYDNVGSTPTVSVDDTGIAADNKVMQFLSHIDFPTDTKTYIDTYTQTLVLACVSTLPAESKRLADIVFNGLKYNVEDIMELGFQKVTPVSVGKGQTISGDSNPDLISTPVVVAIAYTVKWTSTPKNPVLLNSVDIKVV